MDASQIRFKIGLRPFYFYKQLTEACQRGPCGLSAAAGAVEERYEREGANVQTHHLLMAGNPALSHWYKLEDVK